MVVDPIKVDRLLVEELNLLSVNDRERVLEEVHGISAFDTGTGGNVLEEGLIRMQSDLCGHYYNVGADPEDYVRPSPPSNSSSHSKSRSSPLIYAQNTNNTKCVVTQIFNISRRRGPGLSRHGYDPTSLSSSSPSFYGAYREARSKNSTLLSDIKFQRGFLVAENFNPKRAALRMMKYLDMIQKLFETSDVLFRPIFLNDLHTEAKEQLVMGSYQMLPDRDSSGRRVFVYLRDICPSTVSFEHRMQVFLYFSQKLVEDSVGMINVTFLHNSTLFTGAEDTHSVFERTRKLVECLPSRFHAIHLCMPNKPFYNVVKSAIMLLMGRENRYRVRIHVGTHLECHCSLATFGIPVNRLPMALDLNITLRKDNITYHTKWLRMQEEKERAIRKIHFDCHQEAAGSAEQQSETNHRDFDLERWNCGGGEDEERSAGDTRNKSVSTSGAPKVVGMKAVTIFQSRFVECPRHEDCLFGRGRNTMKHPGNVAMRSLLEEKRVRYARAAHQKKSEIAWEVVNEIKTGGGRFLKELDTRFFTLVDNETARKKISIAFRDSKNKVGKRTQRIHRKQQQQQQNEREGKRKRTTSRHPTMQNYSTSGGSTSGADSEIDFFQKCF